MYISFALALIANARQRKRLLDHYSCILYLYNSGEIRHFPYSKLEGITNMFDKRPKSEGGNCIGEGGYGHVFYGEYVKLFASRQTILIYVAPICVLLHDDTPIVLVINLLKCTASSVFCNVCCHNCFMFYFLHLYCEMFFD